MQSLRFIEQNKNILFIGSSGVGKTNLATSIGTYYQLEGHKIIYNLYCQKTGDWNKYYKMPWEAYADYLGGVKR